MPIPTGVDIANTIKYFSQTLLSKFIININIYIFVIQSCNIVTAVLKDVPNYPYELLKDPDNDNTRLSLFPSLDYKGLYNALLPLLEVAPLIQNGLDAFGQAVLQCLGCLLPFLDGDLINHLPYLTASSIAVLPASLHQHIVNYLCLYILPFTIREFLKDDTFIPYLFSHSSHLCFILFIICLLLKFIFNICIIFILRS